MTPDEAYIETRDRAVSLLMAQAAAQGVALDVGQAIGMIDTALEQSGLRVLLAVAQTADVAAGGYAGSYEEVPAGLEDVDQDWRDRRALVTDYPFGPLFAEP